MALKSRIKRLEEENRKFREENNTLRQDLTNALKQIENLERENQDFREENQKVNYLGVNSEASHVDLSSCGSLQALSDHSSSAYVCHNPSLPNVFPAVYRCSTLWFHL